ncbi:mediator of DNA damage checkpoint protein 1-like [Tachypleus tridentatus]|uniref:mediator of DNA damage checkpoint protein 1-like n=1 Tax=Tachypleus tridentatus TaxID=6853 RepID=UPI003FD1F5A5
MFTGLNDEDNGRKIVSYLEWDLVDSVMECSHLVTDKFHRTVKMLCCVAKGIPIVSTEWLKKCCASRAYIDHSLYIINDKKAEKHHNFSLAETLKKAAEQPLLTGWSIHVTPNVVPSPDQMKEIILCAGGKFVRNMPTRLAPRLVIVSTPEDVKLLKHAVKCGIPVVETEFILTGLLRYELNTTIFSLNI